MFRRGGRKLAERDPCGYSGYFSTLVRRAHDRRVECQGVQEPTEETGALLRADLLDFDGHQVYEIEQFFTHLAAKENVAAEPDSFLIAVEYSHFS